DNALDGGVIGRLLHDLLELDNRGLVEHVHRTAGDVPRDQRNAVGIVLNLEIPEGHLSLPSITAQGGQRRSSRRAHHLSACYLDRWARFAFPALPSKLFR